MNNNRKTGKAIVCMSIIIMTVVGLVFIVKNHEGLKKLFAQTFADEVQGDDTSEPYIGMQLSEAVEEEQKVRNVGVKVIYEPVMPKNFELPESTCSVGETEVTGFSSYGEKKGDTDVYAKSAAKGAKTTKKASKGAEKVSVKKTSDSAEKALSVGSDRSRNTNLSAFRRMSDSDWSILEKIIESITDSEMNRVEKIKAVHDYLIKSISYDLTYTQHNASDTLNNGIAVCSGYSALFANAMDVLGIPNCELSGNSRNSSGEEGRHAWSAVKLEDEKWYIIDLTWDDPLIEGTSDYKNGENLRYDYFLVASCNITDSHIPDSVPSPLAKENCPWWEYIGRTVDDGEEDTIVVTDIEPVVNPIPDPGPVVIVPIPDPIIVVPEPDPVVVVPEPDPIIVVPEPDPIIVVPEPDPVIVVPEPDPVIVVPEPDPVIVVPEPDPIVVPEPDPVSDSDPEIDPSPSESGFRPKDPSLGIDFGKGDNDGPGEFTAGVLIDGVWYSEKDSIVLERTEEYMPACGYFELPDDID